MTHEIFLALNSQMGTFNSQAFAVTLLLLATAARGNDDVLSPLLENICREVECGKGSCEAAPGYPFNFKCNCNSGWKRSRFDDDIEKDLQFLPCIIPNCSLDYSCMAAPPPIPPLPYNYNTSFFDPCHWIYCGEGTCTKNQSHAHTCRCNSGHSNLLNVSAFPCYPDCAIGSESCERLGITRIASTSPAPSSTSSDNTNINHSNNQAKAFSHGKWNWMVILLGSTAVIF